MADPYPLSATRLIKLESLVQELQARLAKREAFTHPWKVDIIQPVANGAPAAAPTFGETISGSITGHREWAFQYVSTETRQETALSPALDVLCPSVAVSFNGARSTDARMDKVQIVTRVYGDTDLAWRVVDQIANPTSGNWYYTDGSPYSSYVGNSPPLSWRWLLDGSGGAGFKLRSVRLFADGTLAPSSSPYWIFGLEVHADQRSLARKQLLQDTTKVGLTARTPYPIPLFRQFADAPNTDLDWALEERDRLYLTMRGVGAVTPLPRLSAMVDVTREVV